MANKEGKPIRNKTNLNKRLKIIQKNAEIIARLKKEL
jgi:hypothetical protein